jgi:hypothetical protein
MSRPDDNAGALADLISAFCFPQWPFEFEAETVSASESKFGISHALYKSRTAHMTMWASKSHAAVTL